jgi:hypothetical protein
LYNCKLSGAAGKAIGAALLTNQTLQKLMYGALLCFFDRPFFYTPSRQKNLLTFYISFPFFPSFLQLGILQPVWSHQRSN